MLPDERRMRILHIYTKLGTIYLWYVIYKIRYGSAAIVRSQESKQIIIF